MRVARTLIAISCALTLSLVTAGAAQAFEWEIEEEPLQSLEITKESTSSSGGAFELTAPEKKVTIKCTAESGTGEIKTEATSSSTITLTGCTVSEVKNCTVQSPGKKAGELSATTTTKFLQLEVSSVEKFYDETTLEMTINYTGELCALPEKVVVSGVTAGEVPKVGETAKERTTKFSKTSAEQSGVKGLTYGAGSKAFLIGELKTKLTGAHAAQPQAVTVISFNPDPVAFTGTGGANAKLVTIKNNSATRVVKYTEIGVLSTYGLEDPNTCINRQVAAMGNCIVKVICNMANTGKLVVHWDMLGAGGGIIAFGITKARMTC
jgi:hypothetical protein